MFFVNNDESILYHNGYKSNDKFKNTIQVTYNRIIQGFCYSETNNLTVGHWKQKPPLKDILRNIYIENYRKYSYFMYLFKTNTKNSSLGFKLKASIY